MTIIPFTHEGCRVRHATPQAMNNCIKRKVPGFERERTMEIFLASKKTMRHEGCGVKHRSYAALWRCILRSQHYGFRSPEGLRKVAGRKERGLNTLNAEA